MLTNRLESFSDGVFSVAITLLVLNIVIPAQTTSDTLSATLMSLWPTIITYVVTAILVGIFWICHHIMFKFIVKADRNLFLLNIFLLVCVGALPFAASIIAKFPFNSSAVVTYGAVLFLVSITYVGVWKYARVHGNLTSELLTPEIARIATLAISIAPIGYAIAILISLINPAYGLMMYLIIPLVYALPGPIDQLVEK